MAKRPDIAKSHNGAKRHGVAKRCDMAKSSALIKCHHTTKRYDLAKLRIVPADMTPALVLLLAACGGGGGGGSSGGGSGGSSGTGGGSGASAPIPTPTLPVSFSGRVYDGPVKGADVYIDVNGNGVVDTGVDVFLATTDGMGGFDATIPVEHRDKPLVVDLDGAVDLGEDLYDNADDVTLSGEWRAPAGSEVLSPLTELMVSEGLTLTQLRARLGLPDDVDVTQYDPFSIGEDADDPAYKEQVLLLGRFVAQDIDNVPENIVLELAIYENHPTHKAVYQAQSGSRLTAGHGDNDLFRITSDGRIWWHESPDYENAGDSDSDNVYHLRIEPPDNSGHTDIDITVQDIETEFRDIDEVISFHPDRGSIALQRDFFEENQLPVGFAINLIGYVRVMPESGPLIITWSLVLPEFDDGVALPDVLRLVPEADGKSALTGQEEIDIARDAVERAVAEYEAATNVKFIEVSHDNTHAAYVNVLFDTFLNNDSGRTGAGVITLDGFDYGTIVHEFGHVLSLEHPFEDSGGDFPFDELYRNSPLSVMSYASDILRRSLQAHNPLGLQEADIAALQWLYGAPGTDYDGVQALLDEAGIIYDIS